MDPLSLIVSVLGVCFFLAYVSFQIKDEHWPLKIITLFVALYLLLFVPKFNDDTIPSCENVINATNLTSGFTTYHYMTLCMNQTGTDTKILNTDDDNDSFYTTLTYVLWIYSIYLVFYFMLYIVEKLRGNIKS